MTFLGSRCGGSYRAPGRAPGNTRWPHPWSKILTRALQPAESVYAGGMPGEARGREVGEPVAMVEASSSLCHNRTFLRLWFAQVVSGAGSRITGVALPFTDILTLSATPAQMGLLGVSGSPLLQSQWSQASAPRFTPSTRRACDSVSHL